MQGAGLTFWDRLLLIGLCGAGLSSSRPAAPLTLEPAEDPPEASVPLRVQISPPAVLDSHRWAAEATGHAVVLTERRLADVDGLVPAIDGLAVRPGLVGVTVAPEASWSLGLELRLSGDTLTLMGQLCDAAISCTHLVGASARLEVHHAVDAIVTQVAEALGREAPAPSEGESADPYAVLMLGRACAALLGMHPAATGSVIGDVRRDPMARATLIDPAMHTAWWVRARYANEVEARRALLERAVDANPSDVALLADLASTLAAEGNTRLAWERWSQVGKRAPEDARYALARVDAALAVGEIGAAQAVLERLPAALAEAPVALAAKVAVAEARGGASDELLARWQEADPSNPEPVRRRITALVDAQRPADALALTSELALRGEVQEASRMVLALASGLGRLDEAVRAAEALGDEEAAGGLRARRAGADPAEVAEALVGSTVPETRLARAEALLRAGQVREARRELTALLDASPWWPDALAVAAQAAEAASDDEAAAQLWSRLRHADPLYAEARR